MSVVKSQDSSRRSPSSQRQESSGLNFGPNFCSDVFQNRPSAVRLSKSLRWTSFASGLVLLALLATARSLTPSPTGLGTHQQLGLPACTTMVIWDLPCPACGMTTSWAWATRFQFSMAAQSNLGGLLLAIIAMAYLPASCYFSWYGVATRGQWFSMALAASLVTTLVVTWLHWLVKLWL